MMKRVLKTLGVVLIWLATGGNTFGQPAPGSGEPLQSWSFNDTNYWTTDYGYLPVSFTNITASMLGDGAAVEVNSNSPAWLQYNVHELDGTTNLTVDVGSLTFWFAPVWAGRNEGGGGPGTLGRLIETGSAYSNGWWSLYLNPAGVDLYFSAQTNGGPAVGYLAAPIAWTNNVWHFIALTYSATNSMLYLDGELAASGPGITNFPGPEVLTNGFFIGSDNTGNNQAQGVFDDIYTYSYPLDGDTVSSEFLMGLLMLSINPFNEANFIQSAPPTPSATPALDAIAGLGYLQFITNAGNCTASSNYWLTNVSASLTGTNVAFTFTIGGGVPGGPYDVFATTALPSPFSSGIWSWMGQGFSCDTYSIPNLPVGSVFFLLGSTQDSDGDGLSDAYELLVSKTNPNVPDTLLDGISDLFKVLHSLPLTNIVAIPSLSSISIPTCAVP